MAKSVKQQMYEQLANQHVQQALNNIGMQQFQEAYNQWNAEQEGLANFQAAYNAWNEANPLQTPEPVQQVTQPVAAPVAQPKQSVPVLEKTKVTAPTMEDYFRQQQEESMLQSANKDKGQKYKDAVSAGRDILFSKEADQLKKQNAVNNLLSKGQQSKPIIGANVSQVDLSKYNLPESNGLTDEEIKNFNDLEKAKQWTQEGYKLTKEEAKEAQRIARENIARLEKPTEKTSSPAYFGRRYEDMTPEEQAEYDLYKNLDLRSNKLKSFAVGAADKLLDYGKTILAGNAETQARRLSAEAEARNALGLNSVASPEELRQIEGETKENIQNVEEQVAPVRDLAQGAPVIAQPTLPVIGQIDITPYGAGQFTTQALAYGATNPAFDAFGTAMGGGKAAGFIANQIGQNAQDLVLDTSLVVRQALEDGVITPEEEQAIQDNIRSNGIGNGFFGGLQEIPALAKLVNGKFKANNAADEAFRANVRAGADKLAELARPADDVVESATKQANDAAQRIEELAKQIPPDDIKLDDSEIKSLLGGMEPPEQQKYRPTPEELRELEAEANTMDEIEDYSNIFKQQEAPKAEVTEQKYLSDSGVDNPTLSFEQNDRINGSLTLLDAPFEDSNVTKALSDVAGEIQSDAGIKAALDYESLYTQYAKAADPEAAQAIKGQLKEIRDSLKNVDKAEQGAIKQWMDYWDIYYSLQDYKKALNGTDREAVDSAKRALDAARNRLARGKGKNPTLQSAFSGNYGKVAGNAANDYGYKATDNMDIVQDWVEQDAKNTNKYAQDISKAASETKGGTPEGAYDLQYFGSDGDDWNTSRFYTNQAKKQGWDKNLDARDYAYRIFHEGEQRESFIDRYKDSDNIVRDLVEKDAFDEVDMRGAERKMDELMNGSLDDVRRGGRLGKKIQLEGREGGRLLQAMNELNSNTPTGMLMDAQSAINDAVDKRVGKGTSEALDNLYEKIAQAYDAAKNKDEFAKQLEDLLSGDLKEHVSAKTAKSMKSKQIKGLNKIMKMLDNAEDLKDIPFDDLMAAMYKANGGVALSPKAQQEIYQLLKEASNYEPDSYQFRVLQAKAARKVMAEVPSGLGDYIRAFLYDNMLGNFKTAFSRNFLGNVAYQSLEKVRELPTAAVDWATSKVTKKHSALGWNKGKAGAYAKGFKTGAAETWGDITNGVNTTRSGQRGMVEALKNNATVHNDNALLGHWANQVDFYIENGMKGGDRPIYEANYAEFKTELEQLLDRYGKDGVVGLEKVDDADVPVVIDKIAQLRAADAVFQKKGHMSEGLTKLRDGLGELSKGALGVDVLSTSSTPFTLTPGNMAERAIEYTPLGIIKNAIETGKELANGTFDQRRFVEEAGRTITGLPVLLAAYAGAKKGLVNGGLSTDQDEKQAQLDDGYIEYGLNVPEYIPILGGKTLDTSDLPVYGPFMQAGSVMAEEGLSPKASLQAAEAVLGGSTTQGIRRAFGADSGGYSSQNGVVENLTDTVKSAGTQLVPSLVRQTAQTTDKYKRDLGEYGTNEYYLNSIKNSIPGLRQTLPKKTDVEGQPILQNQGRNLGSKILENYVLPMNMSEYKPSPLNDEASRLLHTTDKAWAFQPKALRSNLREWDEKAGKEFTEDQFRRYKADLGQKNTKMGNALLKSDYYKDLDDEAKVAAMRDVYAAMKALAKETATGLPTDDKIVEAYKKGKEEGVINYLHGKDIIAEAEISMSSNAAKEAMELASKGKIKEAQKVVNDYKKYKEIIDDYDISTGVFLPSDSAKEIQAKVADGDVSGAKNMAKQISSLESYGLSADSGMKNYSKAKDVIPSLTTKEFAKTFKGMAGEDNTITQTEFLDYINSISNLSPEKAQEYLRAYGGWTNKKGEEKKLVGSSGHYKLEY